MNRKIIFAAIIGVVFLFAGYNLYSYFQEQAVIAAEEERLAEERRIEREREAAEREAARQAEAEQREAERIAAETAAEEAREAERRAEEARIAEEQAERAEQERIFREEQLRERIARAREIRNVEGLRFDVLEGLRSLSPRYIVDHPEEFRSQRFSAANMGVQDTGPIKVFFDNSSPLMLYAAITAEVGVLQALIDLGLDINEPNEAGVTPLMFAATYNGPEVIRYLVGQGADISAVSYINDMNALHFAARHNPNPETLEALLEAGLPLEAATSTGATAALLAASQNPNMEVIERLARHGADLTIVGHDDQTALAIAEQRLGVTRSRPGSMETMFTPISDGYREQVLSVLRGEQ